MAAPVISRTIIGKTSSHTVVNAAQKSVSVCKALGIKYKAHKEESSGYTHFTAVYEDFEITACKEGL